MNANRVCGIVGILIWLAALPTAQGFYNPNSGKWLNRDPIGQEGGANLYGWVGNDAANAIDPVGLDFIAVGDRYVRYTPGLFRHMSIEFFIEDCPIVSEGTRFSRGSEPAARIDSFELQPLMHSYRHFLSDGTFVWDIISEIRRRSTPRDFIVIYADIANPNQDALRQWTAIVVAATTYQYGEQESDWGTLHHWANSRYRTFGNNSNTFVREMARVIGRNADVIGGWHPGNIYAVPVPYPGYDPVFSPWGSHE